MLFIANKWNTYKTGYLFKMFQITEYNWLSDENLQKCIERLYKLNISNKARFEYKCIVEDNEELCNRQLTGYFDCIDENKLRRLSKLVDTDNDNKIKIGKWGIDASYESNTDASENHFKINYIESN